MSNVKVIHREWKWTCRKKSCRAGNKSETWDAAGNGHEQTTSVQCDKCMQEVTFEQLDWSRETIEPGGRVGKQCPKCQSMNVYQTVEMRHRAMCGDCHWEGGMKTARWTPVNAMVIWNEEKL